MKLLLSHALAIVLIAASYSAAPTIEPVSTDLCKFAPSPDYLVRGSYLVSWDGSRRTFRWTLELLDRQSLVDNLPGPRPDFRLDADVPSEFSASPRDYAGSGWDQGHGAADRNHNRSQAERDATYTIANVMPQSPNLNRGTWARLESHVRDLARVPGTRRLWCVTAPAWLSDSSYFANGKLVSSLRVKLIGKSEVWVPSHCCKAICIERDDGTLTLAAWVLPNVEDAPADYDKFRVTTNAFERAVGIDAWHGIVNEDILESNR
jgi:endonuclease G